MRVFEEAVTRPQQENGREQVPLNFQQPIRADIESFADNGIGGTDDRHDQNQPGGEFAHPLVQTVNAA
jgi:hypothetical protein